MISREKLESSLHSVFNSEDIQTVKNEIPARLVVYPKSRDQLCELVTFATANGFTLIPLGSGSRLAGNGKYNLAVTTSHLDEQIEHSPADMVATIPAGASFSLTQSSLQKHGQRIPLDPQVEDGSTIGGIVSANAWGPLRHRFGTAKNSILATTIVNGECKIVKAGAKVVKNVSGYDLNKLYIGARGSLGILLDVTFRLQPLPEKVQIFSVRLDSLHDAFQTASTGSRLPLMVETVVLRKSPDWEVTIKIAGSEEVRKTVEDAIPGDISWGREVNYSENSDSLYDINISVPKSYLKSFFKSVGDLDGLSLWSLPEVGICRLNLKDAGQLQQITICVESGGGFMEVERKPEGSDIPRWPIAPHGLNWMRQIKSAFDPHGIFAPGILGKGL